MSDDLKSLQTTNQVIVFADKTTNLYKIDMDNYNKQLRKNLAKRYKKASANASDEINQNAKSVASPLQVADRMDVIASKNAFITLKDHKDKFASNPKCRLINHAKTEICIISKKYLENINSQFAESTTLNQWRNTDAVIEWFKPIPNKQKSKFIKFDIVDFYPTISLQLLKDLIGFAKLHTTKSEHVEETIFKSRKSLLFDNNEPWIKKDIQAILT